MFNLSETGKISCYYELFITAGVSLGKRTELICTPNIIKQGFEDSSIKFDNIQFQESFFTITTRMI